VVFFLSTSTVHGLRRLCIGLPPHFLHTAPKLEFEITPSTQESFVAGTMESSQEFKNPQQPLPASTTASAPSNLKSAMSATMKLATEPVVETLRRSHLNLDAFSPVNEHGSFEFDRVLKTGAVLKRTRKTKVKN
jgi:hypothetical protein